jgi:LacI family transcriptional regulator
MAVMDRSTHEDRIVRGVIDYANHLGTWELVGRGTRPFISFADVDLGGVDGVISNFNEQSWVDVVSASDTPAVNTSSRFAHVPLPTVSNDDVAIGRMGAEYLLGRGFEHYGFLIAGDAGFSRQRLAGFRQVIEQHAGRTCHIPPDEVRLNPFGEGPLPGWLRDLPRPIAIMAATDTRGRQLINAARELDLRVPEDVAVLGVDNDEWLTALATPMSSIVTDGRQIGYRAARRLNQLMQGQAPPEEPEHIPPVGVATRRSTDISVGEDPLVMQALRYMRDHCGQSIAVEDVLNEVNVSRTTLETRMKRAIGQTPREAITRAQVDKAKDILISAAAPMGEVAQMCGFRRANHFSTVFKRLTGITPVQYRQQRRGYGTP